MVVFCLFRYDAYFLTIIAGIENTEGVASDFSNVWLSGFARCYPNASLFLSLPPHCARVVDVYRDG